MVKKLDKMAKSRRNETMDREIDDNIRRVYSEMAEEPVPERFSQLLDKLRKQEQGPPDDTSEDAK